MFMQLPPPELQRCHAKLYVIGSVPLQAPLSAVSVWPSWVVPEIVGGDVFVTLTVVAAAGVAAVATAVATEVTEIVPSALVAVTTTRRVLPMSCFASM